MGWLSVRGWLSLARRMTSWRASRQPCHYYLATFDTLRYIRVAPLANNQGLLHTRYRMRPFLEYFISVAFQKYGHENERSVAEAFHSLLVPASEPALASFFPRFRASLNIRTAPELESILFSAIKLTSFPLLPESIPAWRDTIISVARGLSLLSCEPCFRVIQAVFPR